MSDQCKITLLFLFIIVFPLTSHAQNFEKIDSLKSELEKTNNDSLKIELNDQLFRNYYQYDPEIAKGYYESILDLAGNTNNVNGMYKGYFAGAIYYTMLSQFDSALFYFNEAHKYAEVLNNEELRIESLLAISHTHLWKNEMELAKKAGFRSLKLSEEIHDSTSMALSYKNLGEIYSLENHLDSATSFYLKAINILEDSGKERSKLGDLYTGIGEIYINLNELEKAEEFLDKSIELFEKIQDTDGVMFASAMKGGMYFSKDNYEAAIEILHPVLKYYESVGDPYRISETNRYLGLSYLNRDNRSEAKKYLSEAVIKGREANEPINLAEALMAYGNLHLMRKAYQDAHKLFIEAEDLYSEVGFLKGKIKSTEMLSSLYEKMGDHATSNTLLKELMDLKDSLNEIENASVVQELEARYQNEKKQHQIDLLENENRLNELERSRQRKIFIVSIIVALVIIFLLYFLYKTNQKANKKLKELDAFKSRFFANISHEFRTPLTLISGPVENRLKQPGLSQQERTELELVHRNSKQLLDLVDQLLDLSKIESGGFKLNVGSGDLTNLMKTLVSSFEYAAEQKKHRF